MSKYGFRDPFEDPVVRCYRCTQLILRKQIHSLGQCPKCGSKRVANVTIFDDKELKQMKQWKVDPAYLECFEEVSDAPNEG